MDIHDGLNEYLMPLRTVAQSFARVDVHRRMLADRARVEAFARAIAAQVKPGDVVVEIGTGVGLLAMLAVRAGARKVYAIEVTEMADIATEVIEANGMAEQIEVRRGFSTELELPERGDLLISETLGHIGIDEGIVQTVADARQRLLKPEARLIPCAIDLMLAPTTDEGFRKLELNFWQAPIDGFDLSAAGQVAKGRVYLRSVYESSLVGRPTLAAQVDLRTATRPPDRLAAEFTIRTEGEVTGMSAWFECDLGAGLSLNSRSTSSWLPLLFPVDPPLPLRGLEGCAAVVTNAPIGDEVAWSWTVGGEREQRTGGRSARSDGS